jgi:hypothetical protein
MRFGTHQFPGDAGKHVDSQGLDCLGRTFETKAVGTGAAYTNYVICTVCQRELAATEDRLLPNAA